MSRDTSLVPYSEVEVTADAKRIYLRSGGLCNPGGVATYCQLEPWEIRRPYAAGHRCGHAIEIVSGEATGVVRASLSAMSTPDHVRLISFLRLTYVGSTATETSVIEVPNAQATVVVVKEQDIQIIISQVQIDEKTELETVQMSKVDASIARIITYPSSYEKQESEFSQQIVGQISRNQLYAQRRIWTRLRAIVHK